MIELAVRLLARYSHINWALADQTMVSGVNFLTGILLARYLGIEEFGRFTLAWMAVLLFNSIQHAAINSPMMSLGPGQPGAEAPAYYGAVMVHQVVFSGLVFLLLLVGVRLSGIVFPEWRVEGLALPLAVAAVAFQFQDFLRRYFFTLGRPAEAFVGDMVRYLGQIAVLFWLFQVEQMVNSDVLWVIASTAGCATLYGSFFVARRIEWVPAVFRTTSLRHWHFSKWLVSSTLMKWASGHLMIMIAGILLGPTTVGGLKAAQNLMGITHVLFQGLENVVPIQAAQRYLKGGPKVLLCYLRRVSYFGGLTTAAMSAFAAAAPELWLRLVFGQDYAVYANFLRWYALIYIFIFFSFPLIVALRTIESTHSIFWANAATALFAVSVGYPLVENFGPTAVVASQLFINVLFISVLFTAVKLRFMET